MDNFGFDLSKNYLLIYWLNNQSIFGFATETEFFFTVIARKTQHTIIFFYIETVLDGVYFWTYNHLTYKTGARPRNRFNQNRNEMLPYIGCGNNADG